MKVCETYDCNSTPPKNIYQCDKGCSPDYVQNSTLSNMYLCKYIFFLGFKN